MKIILVFAGGKRDGFVAISSRLLRLLRETIPFLLLTQASAQDSGNILRYPSEKELKVTARASVVKFDESFKYQYTLISSSSSAQKGWEYSLFGVSNYDSLKNPIGWDVGVSQIPRQRVTWASSDSNFDLVPGGSVGEFSVISKGLPSIEEFYVRGYVDVPAITVEPDSVAGGLFPDSSFHGTTIGPINAPIPFRPLPFIDSVKSYVSRSRSIGWITLQETANKYLDYFWSAHSQLQAGSETEAIGTLRTVLRNADQDRSTVLSSEAYALIHYNTEYLMARLQEIKR